MRGSRAKVIGIVTRLLILLLFLPLLPPPSFAIAAACTLADAQPIAAGTSGPYALAFGVRPPDPAVGTAQLVVQLCDAAGAAVPEATVSLVPTRPDGARGRPVLALNRSGEPGNYTADVAVRQAGRWQYQIRVDSPRGQAEFEAGLDVRGAPERDDPAPGLFFAGVGTAVTLGAVYFVLRSQRRT